MYLKKHLSGLQLIINTNSSPLHDYIDLAQQAIAADIDCIQFRHKGLFTRDIYELAKTLAKICSLSSVPLIINDRLDVALAVDASGVHLGQDDLPIYAARKIAGNKMIIGATASTLEQVSKAANEGADYIGLGHIYPTKTKIKTYPPLGLETLSEICSKTLIPIFAIGGISEHNIADVCAAGAHGIAVVSAICEAANPYAETKKLREMIHVHSIVKR